MDAVNTLCSNWLMLFSGLDFLEMPSEYDHREIQKKKKKTSNRESYLFIFKRYLKIKV